MMMRTADGGAVVHALDLGPARKPLPRWVWGAVAASVALHVVGGVYLYQAKFVVPEIVETPDPLPPFTMIRMDPKPLRPEPVKASPPKPPTPVHEAKTPTRPVEVSPLPAPDKPVTATSDKVGYVPPSEVYDKNSTTTAPVTEAAPPAPRVIRNPQWVSKPTSSQMARWYPLSALEKNVDGRVVMNCSVTASGSVTNCAVTSEDPAGYGFGDAAVKLSKYFKMSPRTVDGQPVEGGTVTIPMRFGLH